MKQVVSAERALANATASVKMEGLTVTPFTRELCKKLLNKEITKSEYVQAIMNAKEKQGDGLQH